MIKREKADGVSIALDWKKTLFQVSISCLIAAAMLFFLPVRDLLEAIKQASLADWLLCVTGTLCIHILGILKWRLQLSAAHVSISFSSTARCYCAGLFANVFMPSAVGGDLLRMGFAIKETGKKGEVVLASVIDRFGDVLALLLLALLGTLLMPGLLGIQGQHVLIVVTLIVFSSLGAVAILMRKRPGLRWPHSLRKRAILLRISLKRVFRNYKLALIALVLSLAMQVVLTLFFAFLASSMEIKVSWWVHFFALPLAKLTAMVPISFGGIGVQEASLLGLLIPFNIDPTKILALGVLWRGVIIMGGVGGGTAWLFLNSGKPDKLKRKEAYENRG